MTSNAPNLSRYQPAVVLAAGLAAATSIYLVYSSFPSHDETRTSNLQRRNAVRRRTRQSSVGATPNGILESASYESTNLNDPDTLPLQQQQQQPQQQNQGSLVDIEDVATEVSFDGNDEQVDEEGQKLRELMFAISKNKAKNEGLIHRGVTCDNCGRVPILGIRYHCTNCPDFDLCEDCEAQECHLKTHIFYKIRVPASWGGKHPTPVWYPGRPQDLPPELDHGVKKRLSEISSYKSNRIDGLYQQFSCLANKPLENDPCDLGMGIDKVAFDRCFVAQSANKTQPYPNLVHDRLFRFFDQDRDGLIGFQEFVMGMTLAQSKDKEDRKIRIFRSLDLDDDGFVSRKDLLRFFRANFILNKNIMVEYFKADRTGDHADRVTDHIAARDFISSGRPLSSYFGHGPPEFGQLFRVNSNKMLDEFGDQIPIDADISTVDDDDVRDHDLISRELAITNTWIYAFDLVENDICRAIEFKNLIWTTPEDVRSFDSPVSVSASIPGAEIIIRPASPELIEVGDMMWAKFRFNSKRAGCLRITQDDVEKVLGSKTRKDRDWKTDRRSLTHVIAEARDRICLDVRTKMQKAGQRNLEDREYYHKFHLKEEQNTKFKYDRRSTDNLNYISDDSDSSEDDDDDDGDDDPDCIDDFQLENDTLSTFQGPRKVSATEKLTSNGELDHITSTRINRNSKAQLPRYIGDSPAAQTIYTVTQQALNELLDPLFKQCEDFALEIASTHDERQERHAEIQKALMRHDGDTVGMRREEEWKKTIETCFKTHTWPEKAAETDAGEIFRRILAHNQSTNTYTATKIWSYEEEQVVRSIAVYLREGKFRDVQRMLLNRIDQLESFRRRRITITTPTPPSLPPPPSSAPPPSTSTTNGDMITTNTSQTTPPSTTTSPDNTVISTPTSSTASSLSARRLFENNTSLDPTMPQNRPSNSSNINDNDNNNNEDSPSPPSQSSLSPGLPVHPAVLVDDELYEKLKLPKMPPEQLYKPKTPLYRLVYLHLQEKQLLESGCGPGCLNFDQFSKKIEDTEDNGEKALKWIEGWLDMVMF